MKKIVYSILKIALLVVTTTSCAKSTKGKITADWRVISYNETSTNGDTVSTFSTGDSPKTPNTLTIDKDGTWIWNRGVITSGVVFGGSVFLTNETTIKQNGTWSFIEKTKGDDFKKNERVLFNILSEVTTSKQTGGGGNPIFPDTTVTSSKTYLTGENAIIYTITKSARKELKLESENEHFNSSQGVVTSGKIKFILERR